jgi:hypothetical protein
MREVMLIVHLIGLTLGVGSSFAFIFIGRAASKLGKEEAQKFFVNALPVGTMGHIGITLLIISGGYLMTPFWGALSALPLLIAKLSLVVVLIIFITISAIAASKAKKGDLSQMKKIAKLGLPILLTSLTIMTLAVLVFR